jgi:GNAT superfamily N-acetyltransferase
VDLHLAQINVGTLRAPIDDPLVAPFVEQLDAVNADADAALGFVWRLQTADGNATSLQAFEDPLTISNMSMWASREALHAYMFAGGHRDALRRRAEWFVPGAGGTALWWVPAGTVPTLADGVRRLSFLRRHGSTPHAFGLRDQPPTLVVAPAPLDDAAARELIGELNAELAGLYPEPGANHFGLTPDQVSGDAGRFLVAELDGRPVGCGALRRSDDGSGEIKRMYVRSEARGLKVGAAVLDELEAIGRSLGCHRLALETGHRQPEALGLYRRAGFEPCACWGEYLDTPLTSLCFEKQLV